MGMRHVAGPVALAALLAVGCESSAGYVASTLAAAVAAVGGAAFLGYLVGRGRR